VIAVLPPERGPAPTRGITLEPDENRLIEAARAGDRRAFAELVAHHQHVAFRAAYLITGSEAEAEDAIQEACVKAWLALGRFRPGARFRPWFVQIGVNEARNRRRGAGRRAGLALRLGSSAAQAPPAAPSAEAEALAAVEREELVAALRRLREADQLVITARYFLGLSESEAAVVLGWRHGTLKSRLARALGRLRAALEESA
jgi:RNA polymerase sigma-70 factor (ECF subfamily)